MAGMIGAGAMKLVCRVCQKQYANYTCPRCNSRYCSLPCYKRHSVRCTESFMRDNVVEEMKNVEVSSDNKRKMLEALKRVYADEEDEGGLNPNVAEDDATDETVLSEATLKKIITGDELSLTDLSFAELKAFKRAVAAGELSHLIQPWEPWWLKPSAKSISLSSKGTSLVQPVGESSSEAQEQFPLPPAEALPPFSHLSAAQPSPLLPVHVVELLYSYCFVLRLYNGEWGDSSLDAATDVLAVSKVLSQSALPETVTEVISSCLETICSAAFKHAGGIQLGIAVCDDTAAILRMAKAVIICALADLQRLLEASVKESKLAGRSTRLLLVASRKVYFMLCWANQFGESLPSFAALVDAEKERLVDSRTGEEAAVPKRLSIQEL